MTKKSNETLSSDERKEAHRRSAPGVAVVYEAIRQEAETELNRPNSALFWSGLAAGLCIGFSFISQALLQTSLPDTPWQSLVSKLGYSVGFVIVILGRQQLFTENTLTPGTAGTEEKNTDIPQRHLATLGRRAVSKYTWRTDIRIYPGDNGRDRQQQHAGIKIHCPACTARRLLEYAATRDICWLDDCTDGLAITRC